MATVVAPPEFERVADLHHAMDAHADRVRFIDLAERRDFAVDGVGPPGDPSFQAAFRVLYPVAYTLHFDLKRRGIQAPVGALEGLYWFDGVETITPASFDPAVWDPTHWCWSLRLPVPAIARGDDIEAALLEVSHKKDPPPLDALSVVTWTEGPAAQILHVGPYSAEPGTIERLHEAIAAAGLRPRGRHHEIYISDPNRTAPERLKTVIRQPVAPAD